MGFYSLFIDLWVGAAGTKVLNKFNILFLEEESKDICTILTSSCHQCQEICFITISNNDHAKEMLWEYEKGLVYAKSLVTCFQTKGNKICLEHGVDNHSLMLCALWIPVQPQIKWKGSKPSVY